MDPWDRRALRMTNNYKFLTISRALGVKPLWIP